MRHRAHRPPRTLAGDLRTLRRALRALAVQAWAERGLWAWALAVGVTLAVLLGAWFSALPTN